MKTIINEPKIVKEIEIINKQLKNTNHYLTTKGIVSIIVNSIEEQSKRNVFKSLCETCKKRCGGVFDTQSVHECDYYIKKD